MPYRDAQVEEHATLTSCVTIKNCQRYQLIDLVALKHHWVESKTTVECDLCFAVAVKRTLTCPECYGSGTVRNGAPSICWGCCGEGAHRFCVFGSETSAGDLLRIRLRPSVWKQWIGCVNLCYAQIAQKHPDVPAELFHGGLSFGLPTTFILRLRKWLEVNQSCPDEWPVIDVMCNILSLTLEDQIESLPRNHSMLGAMKDLKSSVWNNKHKRKGYIKLEDYGIRFRSPSRRFEPPFIGEHPFPKASE